MSSRRHVRPLVLFALVAAVVLALPALASAETITVSRTTDAAPVAGECFGIGSCSLRQAIDTANKNAGADTVVLPADTYELTIPPSGADGIESGDLNIGKGEITIKGAGARKSVVDASGLGDRVFRLPSGSSAEFKNFTISGGHLKDGAGGGIFAEASQLSLEGMAVSGNATVGDSEGGGLEFEGMEAEISSSTISGNRTSDDGGGLVLINSEMLIVDSTIADNVAETALDPEQPDLGAYGGGADIHGGSVNFINSTIAGNQIIDNNGGSPEGIGSALEGDLGGVGAVNTIIADNIATSVGNPGQCEETIGTSAYDIETAPPGGEANCFAGATNLVADPLLAPLANYGGETDTIALYEGSPAIGSAHETECPEFDQRGVERTTGCNIGAWNGAGIAKPLPPAPPSVPATPLTPPLTKTVPASATISKKGKVVVKVAGKSFSVQPGISVSCPTGGSACAVTLKATAKAPKPSGAGTSAKAKPLTIGKASLSVPAGATKALAFKLTKKAANLLVETGKLKATIAVSAAATGAATATAKKSATLKLPPPKH